MSHYRLNAAVQDRNCERDPSGLAGAHHGNAAGINIRSCNYITDHADNIHISSLIIIAFGQSQFGAQFVAVNREIV